MKKSIRGEVVRALPQRTCVACKQVGDKKSLIRLVRTPDGVIDIDVTGKIAGRGAYLCARQSCWEAGISGGKLGHSLKTEIKKEDRDRLLKKWQELVEESSVG
jgi:uncharacterized protein